MKKRLLIAVALLIVMGLFAGGGLLSIFGPSDPTRTDIFLIAGISGNYWTNDRGLGIVDRTGVLNQLMDAPSYAVTGPNWAGEEMAARAGLIVNNPRMLGFCSYYLFKATYTWVAMDAGTIILPGRGTDVSPQSWPLTFSPSDTDPGNKLVYDFPYDRWTLEGKEDVNFVAFALLVDYSIKVGCDDAWEPHLEIFAADGADIFCEGTCGEILPPPPDEYVPPGTPSLSFSHDGSHEKPWAGDTVTLNYRSEPGTEMIEHYVVTWGGTAGCTCVLESHEFVVAGSEDIAVTVAAFDGVGLSSTTEILIDVDFEGEDEEEEEEEESAFNFMLILFYALAEVIVFVVLFLLWRIVPIPPAFKVMLTIAALIIAPVVLFQTGVLESFL